MQKKQENTSLIWFRNNLRVQDNTSLKKAIENHRNTIAVYFFDPKSFKIDAFGFQKTAKYRTKFLIETITDLQKNLADLNITLLTYFESPEDKLHEICDAFEIETIYTQKEWTREEVATNNFIKNTLSESLHFIEDYDQFLYNPDTVSKDFSNIPNVFTAFRKKLEKTVQVPKEAVISKCAPENIIDNKTIIPTLKDLGFENFKLHRNTAFPFQGGETAALSRLKNYFLKLKRSAFIRKLETGW